MLLQTKVSKHWKELHACLHVSGDKIHSQSCRPAKLQKWKCVNARPNGQNLRPWGPLLSHVLCLTRQQAPPTSWGPGGALWAPPAGSGAENFYLIFLPKHHVRTAKQVFLTQLQHFKMLLFKSREKVWDFHHAVEGRVKCTSHMWDALVSWSLTSLFSTNMAISEMKGQGWKVIRTQWIY